MRACLPIRGAEPPRATAATDTGKSEGPPSLGVTVTAEAAHNAADQRQPAPVATAAALTAPKKKKRKPKKSATAKAAAYEDAYFLLDAWLISSVGPEDRGEQARVIRESLHGHPRLREDPRVLELLALCLTNETDPTGDDNAQALNAFFSCGVDVNCICWEGCTPLLVALDEKKPELAKRLLTEWHADPEARSADDYQTTPLWEAANNGMLDVVEALLAAGARADAMAYAMAPVHTAIDKGHDEIAKMLFPLGKELLNEDGYTPLGLAIKKSNEALALAFIEGGADVTHVTGGFSILVRACLGGLTAVAQAVLARGVSPDFSSEGGMPPVFAAALSGHLDVVKVLEAALVDEPFDFGGDNGASILTAAAKSGNVELIAYLMQRGCSLARPGYSLKHFPVHEAALCGHKEALLALVEAGQPIDLRAGDGATPLGWALRAKNWDLAHAIVGLLPQSALTCFPEMTMLHAAVVHEPSLIRTIVQTHGAKITEMITARTPHGETPYHLAVQMRSSLALELLLATDRADAAKHVALKNNDGATAFDLALMSDDAAMVRKLSPYVGADYFADALPLGMSRALEFGCSDGLAVVFAVQGSQRAGSAAVACLRRHAKEALRLATACAHDATLECVLKALKDGMPTEWPDNQPNFLHWLARHKAESPLLVSQAIKALGADKAERLARQQDDQKNFPAQLLEGGQRERFERLARRGMSKNSAQQHARAQSAAQNAAKRIEAEMARLMPRNAAGSTEMTQETFEARVDAVVGHLIEQLEAHAQATPSVQAVVSLAANRAALDLAWRIHHVSSAACWPVGMGKHWLRHAPTLTGASLERRLEGTSISGASQFERGSMVALLQVRSALVKRSQELATQKPGRFVIYLQADELKGRGVIRAASDVASFHASPFVAAVWEREENKPAATLITLYPMAPENMVGRKLGVFIGDNCDGKVVHAFDDGVEAYNAIRSEPVV